MVQRTLCLCDGKYIGIESIYTVVDGKQINISEKVEALRIKSRQNKLTCSCGCGAVLILVAGDRNLREQHFRLKNEGKGNESGQKCHYLTEGKCSVDSKIVLKCWLDDKLKDINIETRVPIFKADDIERKYEFTLLSEERAVAVCYEHERVNLSDEKFNILESNSKGIKIIYIVDELNGGTYGQYPENLMKIQARQGYTLYLSIVETDYYKARLRAVFFDQDIDGLWQEIEFAAGLLNKFEIDERGEILFSGKFLLTLLNDAKEKFDKNKELVRKKREQEKKDGEEQLKKVIEEENRKREERDKRITFRNEQEVKQRLEQEKNRRLEEEHIAKDKKEKEDAFKSLIANDFENQKMQIRDSDGNRWVKCEFCNKIAKLDEFSSYGGIGRVNLGICYDCSRNNPAVHEKLIKSLNNKQQAGDNDNCPECGGKLKEKSGKYGLFIGCSNYPKCRYTRKFYVTK